MKIDISIGINSDKVSVISKTADYSETKLPLMAFSKEVNKSNEVCEAVGEEWTVQKMESENYYPQGTRTFRVVNPFLPQSFEPHAASLMIDFFCRKAFYTMKPSRGEWRLIFGFDSFDLEIKIDNYLLISSDRKAEFEKLLSKRTSRKFVINQ